MKIKITPNMVFDAICFIEQVNYDGADRNLLPEQEKFIEKIEDRIDSRLKTDSLGMSGLCGVITTYAENADFENYTLDDLAELFKNPENMRNVVKSREMSEFQTSYIYEILDLLVNEWAEKYVKMIGILKEAEFDKLWESDLLPLIQEEINKKEETYKNINIDAILTDIQKLKQCDPLGNVKIYMSVMSFPVAFKLHGSSFLDCVYGSRGTGMFCHELMHGFTTFELEKLYLNYIKSIKYLTDQHDKLINEQRSGNEEEFVMAAEYYLRMKHNGEDKKMLLKEARKRYGGCVPTSVFLFDLLSQETETPDNYAEWLTNVFKNKKLPKKAIERNLDIICPKEPIEEFNDKLFASFKLVIAKIKELQEGKSFDISQKIESITNKKFEETNDKSVYFAQERQPLPGALKIKEICVDNLFINTAEYKSRNEALYDRINDDGSNMGPEGEYVTGEKWGKQWCPFYNVNMSCIGKTPLTLSATFIKDNYRISFTARCADYINRGTDYPSTLKEARDHFWANRKSIEETGKPLNIEKTIPPLDELILKYPDEILAVQKKIENIIMQL